MGKRRAPGVFVSLYSLPLLALSLLLLLPLSSIEAKAEKRRVNIVLVGATSSLAKKYLWQSFFKAFLEEEEPGTEITYGFYGGATRLPAEGEKLLKGIVESSTTCKDITSVSATMCEEKRREFRDVVKYVMLREDSNYQDLGATLKDDMMEKGIPEEGRLFYLAIAPDLYPWVAASIDTHARPSDAKAWLRVVFEKPFGRDLASAEALAADLAQRLKEEEIYRVDHYMGKSVVQAILPFRYTNEHVLEGLWNGEHVESLEVAMKETEDCEGRTSFYEGYGVIRDVLQNHLTQVLVLLKMDLPPPPTTTTTTTTATTNTSLYGDHHHRTAVLKTLRLHGHDSDTVSSITVGQYEGYVDHVTADRQQRHQPAEGPTTKVPTAAAVTLASEHPRWQGVKLHFKAGKALEERSSYAKVTMKRRREPGATPCQLIFNIQGGELGSAIAWNKAACQGVLPPLKAPPGWTTVVGHGDGDDDGMVVMRPAEGIPQPNAYEVVVQEVLRGDRAMFLGTEELLHQWAAWDPVLLHADEQPPVIYPPGYDIDQIEATGWLLLDNDDGGEESGGGGRDEL